jgi:formylglycine-generating enzyme
MTTFLADRFGFPRAAMLLTASLFLLLEAGSAAGVEPADLSEKARALIPAERDVTLRLKDGREVRGVVVSDSETQIVLSQQRQNMKFQMAYPKANVVSRQESDLCTYFAAGLEKYRLDSNRVFEAEFYVEAKELFDEFLRACGDNAAAAAIRERAADFEKETAHIARGMEKVGGDWLPPVAGAIRKYDRFSAKMAELEEKFPGIDRPNFTKDPTALEFYGKLADERRSVARKLPGLVTERIPRLVSDAQFEEAAAEMTAFNQFWISRVIKGEATQENVKALREVFQDMDFDYVRRLAMQIVDGYRAKQAAAGEAAAPAEEGMAFVPGGYLLMGEPGADLADNRFPVHIVFVNPFLMDKYEVTNEDYRKFVEYVKSTGDSAMEHPDAPPLKDHTPEGWKFPDLSGARQPVVGVDWFDAYAYAKWRKLDLPTEAEWECAARGGEQRPYPWGTNAPLQQVVNTPRGRKHVADLIEKLTPPPPPPKKGSSWSLSTEPPPPPVVRKVTLPETTWEVQAAAPPQATNEYFKTVVHVDSAYGIRHLAGNAAEWVGDRYGEAFYAVSPVANPTGPETGDLRIFRGGSFLSDTDEELKSSWRGATTKDYFKRGLNMKGKPLAGFRCVKRLAASEPAAESAPAE